MFSSTITLALLSAAGTLAAPTNSSTCTSPTGDLTVSSFQLYPENADFDTQRCVTYFSVLYNASVAVYDANKNAVTRIIELTGLTGRAELHASGVRMRPDGHLSMIINAGAAFDTSGKDISGENFLVNYNLDENKIMGEPIDLNAVSGGRYGGFQDVTYDTCGNAFVVGTYPGSIVKVSAVGSKAVQWIADEDANSTVAGYSGIVSYGNTLIATNGKDGGLYRFDAHKAKGEPVSIPLSGKQTTLGKALDKAHMPAKYGDNVILVSDTTDGTIVVRSEDGWKTAKIVGTIANALQSEKGYSVATVQIGESIYVVTEYFEDAAKKVEGTNAGDRTKFPLRDITAELDAMLNKVAATRR
ncbi:hypothetical protein JDV02_010287 [Purpureocillium takamizusanense]|uniref:Tri14-like protein n=1 Tax=Purpureocillium takamizusanense TaxID=2060973 RepID=A0A9Q8QSE8_9HYPO|nr:uncharacterized protein JDV02_010287 [Purpureocillium takamizusanense]UNI24552.1 hypothetical protein JDV02_010287 [Purpureocillium takamizusanense]